MAKKKKKDDAAEEEKKEDAEAEAGKKKTVLRRIAELPYLIIPKVDAVQAMLNVVADNEGKVHDVLKYMRIRKPELRQWLNLWMEACGGSPKHTISYRRFVAYFNISDSPWTKRVFEIINSVNFNGSLSFYEFMRFCSLYVIVDKDSTIEFSFRVVSRRGANYNAQWSVLDITDFRNYINDRYVFKSIIKSRKRAFDTFTYIDVNSAGGLLLSEFAGFVNKNPAFLKFSHKFQMHFRKCLFGIPFWVQKSRKIKISLATGLDALSFLHRINIDSELFTVLVLKDPVVNEAGQAITGLEADAGTANLVDENEEEEEDQMAAEERLKKEQEAELQKRLMEEASLTFADIAPQATAGSTAQESKPIEQLSKLIAYDRNFAPGSIARGEFVDDFPEIAAKRQAKNLARKKERALRTASASQLAARLNDRLRRSFADVFYGRTKIRAGFSTWLANVGPIEKPPHEGRSAAEEEALAAALKEDIHAQALKLCMQLEEDAEAAAVHSYIQSLEYELHGPKLTSSRASGLKQALAWSGWASPGGTLQIASSKVNRDDDSDEDSDDETVMSI